MRLVTQAVGRRMGRVSKIAVAAVLGIAASNALAAEGTAPPSGDASADLQEILGTDSASNPGTSAPAGTSESPAAAPAADASPTATQASTPESPAPQATAGGDGASGSVGTASLPTIPVKSAAAADAEKPPEHGRQIEEIVVTATKREESLRDIPASITAITGEKLENEGHLNLTDYVRDTPGVTVTQSVPGLTRFSMRGVSTDTSPSSIIPSAVGFFIGDTAFSDPYIASVIPDLSAFDLAGVQVLKGPQGTLFGGAALSGAIRYELQEPIQGQWQARAFTQGIQPQGGSLAFTEGAAVNVPLLRDDNLALRVAYLRREYPGTINDTYHDQKNVDRGSGNQIRAILLWEPEDWKIKLTHLVQDFSAPNEITAVTAVNRSRVNGLNVLPSPASNKFGLDSLELGYAFDGMRLVSLSSRLFKHVTLDGDATSALVGAPPPNYPPTLALASAVFEDSRAFSQEVRLQSTEAV